MTPPIRRATPDDLPACTRIVCDWERETPYMPGHATEDRVLPMMQEVFDAREIWVVGDPVEGYMSIDPAERKIGAIYLTRRGKGIGRALMDLAKQGRNFLWLTVFVPNIRAQAFYLREGFAVVDRLPPPSIGEPEMLRMEWRRAGGEA
ncbi:GNAT family N-acetyltransferase [Maliponia aquimaris]|uniref:Putative acetyltransferase n=1 Tax=Maliponia aquimaris TaxID=1673631 RepID=A0A238L1X3_9RHOB|nr:GNAT family N-acetyltransferase [Maliponia aquimaris]SMX49084.1 putative acetyltransferase [Maliponia aquimaris]